MKLSESLQTADAAYWTTENVMINNRPFSFEKYPFMVELYRMATHRKIVVRKAAQLAFTTYGINTTLWFIKNTLLMGNGLYIFPTEGQVYDFTNARLDPLIDESPAFSGEDRAKVDNKGLKRFSDNRVLYFRGAKSTTKLVEMPANWQVLDEVDKFENTDIISFVAERASGFEHKYFKYLSNPTFSDVGIDRMFNDSTMAEWHITCDECGLEQILDFFDNLDHDDPDRGVFCSGCFKPIDRLKNGRWIHQVKSDTLGYTLSQLYSPTVTPKEMITAWKKCRGEADKQTFYNMKLGKPYDAKGGKLTDEEINNIIDKSRTRGEYEKTLFGGADVGAMIDWVIIDKDKNVIDWGSAKTKDEVSRIFEEYGVSGFVIDAMPETRLSIDLCTDFPGKGAVCYYTTKDSDKRFEDYDQYNRNRSLWLDRMYHDLRVGNISFPIEMQQDERFRSHLKNLIKVVQEAKDGKDKIVKFLRYGKPDHLSHGLNYALIALDKYADLDIRWV